MNSKILVDNIFILQKFPGKGGWTFVSIPEVVQNKNNPFGWVTVKGFIDDFELIHYKLMPMGNERLFLPVKVEIRKKIKKEEGDSVRIILYADDSNYEIPKDFLECLEIEDPKILKKFQALKQGEQKRMIDWIYSAKKEETIAERIIEIIKRLET